ncbi:MAG: trigger factor [Candidatus Aminicenantes bacterium]|nr:trigger factor [Candidatus Aminicenantes bacterium]
MIDATRREIDIEIPAAAAAREFVSALDRTAARVKLDGFRAGRAPRDMVKRILSDDLRHSVIEALAPRAIQDALRSRAVSPLEPPVIRDVRYEEGDPLRFTASFEVWPEFDLPDLRSVQVRKKAVPVGDTDVDAALDSLRQQTAVFVPVEGRGAVDGDYVAVELRTRDLQTKRFFPTDKHVLLAGHADNDPALNAHLAGIQPGDIRTFQIAYPTAHPNRKLAGKSVEHSLKALSVKARKLPDLDDEWARGLGDYAGLEDLKSRVRRELQAGRDHQARREAAEEMIQAIADRMALPLPTALVEREAEGILSEALTGPDGKTVRIPPAEFEALRAEAARRAERKVRNHMILRKIAEAERLEVSEEETDDEIRRLARSHNVPFARLRETFDAEDRRGELRTSLLLKKAVDFLARSAIMD